MARKKATNGTIKKKRVRKKVTEIVPEKVHDEAPVVKHKELLTVIETMELLDISRNTFDKFRKEGVIKVYQLFGSRRLYTKYSEIMQTIGESQVLSA